MTTKNAAVKTAKRRVSRQQNRDGVITLSSGVRARLKPVSVSIIDEAQAMIPDPPVPTWYNEAKDRDEPHPNDPEYLKALERADMLRNLAAIDAMIMFGVEVEGGVPEDDAWLRKIKMGARMGLLKFNESEWDLSDPLEREFIYKKYVAVTAVDMSSVMLAAGVRQEDIDQAAASFRNNQERPAD